MQSDALRLVRSLSGSEKRTFKLWCKKQAGPKDYLALYDLIARASLDTDINQIEKEFQRKYPSKSFGNTLHYLSEVIIDSLVQVKKEKDKWFKQLDCLMRSRILLERSLPREATKELKKAQSLSLELQDNLMYFLTSRMELEEWSNDGFAGKSEQDITQIQMKAKSSLRMLHKIHEQSSLFDILKYRSIHLGKALSKEDNLKLNDLILSELSLVTRGPHTNFESQKLHLMFQSFFFVNTGDYKSSLESFSALSRLFESNAQVWSYPPHDYLSTLEGILDNLRTMGYDDEMQYYIDRVESLCEDKYPETFQLLTKQVAHTYRLSSLVRQGKLAEAKDMADSIPPELWGKSASVDYERLTELLFHIGLVSFLSGDLRRANRKFMLVSTVGKVNYNITIYKASRLMHIITHYEQDDQAYLDHEIRSYKRTFKKNGKQLQTERLLLKVIGFDPKRKSKVKRRQLWDTIAKERIHIYDSRYEKQIIKYFDFLNWIEMKLR